MTDLTDLLHKLRANTAALAQLKYLCYEHSCTFDEVDSDVLTFLTCQNLVEVVRSPVAPIVPNSKPILQKRCIITSLGEDMCSALDDPLK